MHGMPCWRSNEVNFRDCGHVMTLWTLTTGCRGTGHFMAQRTAGSLQCSMCSLWAGRRQCLRRCITDAALRLPQVYAPQHHMLSIKQLQVSGKQDQDKRQLNAGQTSITDTSCMCHCCKLYHRARRCVLACAGLSQACCRHRRAAQLLCSCLEASEPAKERPRMACTRVATGCKAFCLCRSPGHVYSCKQATNRTSKWGFGPTGLSKEGTGVVWRSTVKAAGRATKEHGQPL